MRKFASHRLYIPYLGLFLKNQVVEIDDTGKVVGYYPFTEETSFTEWHNGLIVLSYDIPQVYIGSEYNFIEDSTVLFIDEEKNIRSVLSKNTDSALLTVNAYYISSFNVSEMSFPKESRVIRLG